MKIADFYYKIYYFLKTEMTYFARLTKSAVYGIMGIIHSEM